MADMTDTLPASPELTDEEDRRIAFALANFMSRHIVGEEFASTDETCRLCIDYALTVIAQVRGSERHRSSPSAEWRGIDTAPKDGTEILVYDAATKETLVVFFNQDSGVGWLGARDEDGIPLFRVDDPTHWMPLPEPSK